MPERSARRSHRSTGVAAIVEGSLHGGREAEGYDLSDPRLAEELSGTNCGALLVFAAMASVLVPGFWVLDVFLYGETYVDEPDKARQVILAAAVIRGVATLVSLGVVAAVLRLRPLVRRHVDTVSVVFMTYVSWTIVALCWLHTGLASGYYVGLVLVFLAVGVMYAWPLRLTLLFAALVYGGYLAPAVVVLRDDTPLGGATALNNQFFLVGCMVVVTAAGRYRYRLLAGKFFTEQQLKAALLQVQELDRLKSEFFNNITHELRTPLTLILSPLQSLLEEELGPVSASQRDWLQMIWFNALKQLKLVNNLLDLARMDRRFLKLRVERTNLVPLMSEIVNFARPLARRKRITLVLDARGDEAEDLYCDLEKMERVLVNLTSNALKFTPEGGTVTLGIRMDGEAAEVYVEDTGIGVPAAAREAIFERFSQADGSVTRRYGGTGIGLAFARNIARMHGGEISVRSEEGAGSRFSVRIPRGRAHLDARVLDTSAMEDPRDGWGEGADPSLEPVEWTEQLLKREEYRFLDIEDATEEALCVSDARDERRRTRVLVVEDNLQLLKHIAQVLRMEQHAVSTARNGVEGLRLCQTELPDLVVSDYMMPEMDGMTMLRAIRGDPRTADIPVIMLTAKAQVRDRLDAAEAGADVYMGKPFHASMLRAEVARLLRARGRQVATLLGEHKRSLEAIAGGLAHEINNPLGAVSTALTVLGEAADKLAAAASDPQMAGEPRAKLVGKLTRRVAAMRESGERGIGRIRQMVELVRRYAREGYPEEPTAVVLDEVVADVGALVTPRGGGRVPVEVSAGAGGARVLFIPEELTHTVRNLWQNALDAVEEQSGAGAGEGGGGGGVRVRTAVEGDRVVLTVSDDGVGIPREKLTHIFRPFYSTKGPAGMGVGLSLVHQTVTEAGGTINVASEVGRGTTFTVTLPLCRTREPAWTHQPTPASEPTAAPTRPTDERAPGDEPEQRWDDRR